MPVTAEEQDLPPWPHWDEEESVRVADAYVCYDVRDRSTFANVSRWITDVRWSRGAHVKIGLLGINGARGGPRRVSPEEGRAAARQHGVGFFLETHCPCEGPRCSFREPLRSGEMAYIEWDSVVCPMCRAGLAGTAYHDHPDYHNDGDTIGDSDENVNALTATSCTPSWVDGEALARARARADAQQAAAASAVVESEEI